MKARLICRAPGGKRLTFTLGDDEAVLGREPGLAATVPLDGVSRRHARITWDGRFHWLEDLGSTNGTFLNGQPARRERLRHLDVITLGKRADLVFAERDDEARSERLLGIVAASLRGVGAEGEIYEIPTGEVTLGRSSACNVELDSTAVSKLHARVDRRLTQLVLEDLGSSNGTFVNGVRTTTTLLHDGDVISLGGVVELHVRIELAEVTSASGARSRSDWLPVGTSPLARPQFGSEWRTRIEWSSGELRDVAALRGVAPGAARAGAHGHGTAPVPPAGTPASDEPQTRLGPAARALRAGAPAPVIPPPAPAPAAAAVPAPPRPAAMLAPPAPPAPPRAEAADPAVAPAGPGAIRELHLRGAGFDLCVTAPGAHQLGRALDSPLRVDHPTVSRRHARVILADDRSIAYLQHLGGANGTRLNGAAVDKLAPVRDGDRISVGEVELVVVFRRG